MEQMVSQAHRSWDLAFFFFITSPIETPRLRRIVIYEKIKKKNKREGTPTGLEPATTRVLELGALPTALWNPIVNPI